jgi:hypothetical protein
LLDALVDTILATLDMQVQLIVCELVKVLFKSLVGLLLQAVKVFVDLAKLVLEFFGRLNPEWRQ